MKYSKYKNWFIFDTDNHKINIYIGIHFVKVITISWKNNIQVFIWSRMNRMNAFMHTTVG